MNKIMLMGRLTDDPKMITAKNENNFTIFGLATNRGWINKVTGEKEKETCFFDCKAFGKTGINISKFFVKGRPILLEGRMQMHKWIDDGGKNRQKLEVFVQGFEFIDSKKQDSIDISVSSGSGEMDNYDMNFDSI